MAAEMTSSELQPPPLAPPRSRLPGLADRLPLGDTGLEVSPFCLGMVASEETVGAAFDAGINFFFISGDLHWPLYESARRGLAALLARGPAVRDQVVVGIVSYLTQPDLAFGPLVEAIDAVPGLGRIDVAIAGGAHSDDYVARSGRFRQLRRAGLLGIRAAGMSFHRRTAALDAINRQLVDLAFVRYNPVHRGARTELLPHVAAGWSTLLYTFKSTAPYAGPAAYARLGLEDGAWRPTITDYYRFVLTRPEVNGVLCSLNRPEEVTALARAMEQGPLDEEQEGYLMELGARTQALAYR